MAKKPTSALAGGERRERLAGGLERHVFERHAEVLGERGGEFGRDAARFAVRPLLRQHRIAEIDARAQFAGRRQILEHGGQRRLRHGGRRDGERSGGKGDGGQRGRGEKPVA